MVSILVVEQERVITPIIEDHLGNDGYQAVKVLNGNDAVRYALREIPGLIILNATFSHDDCYDIIQQLRDHPKCLHVPILLVSSCTSPTEKVRAYELGIDSYIIKPFHVDELLAHIRCLLRRMEQITLSPLTRLPGGLQLERAIDYKVRRCEPWSILYLDLDNFKAFNDAYGFLAGNDMILLVSHICQQIVYEYGNADDFVGHIGGDDFMVVTTPERASLLCRLIQTRYEEQSRKFYHDEDLEQGWVHGVDRKGRTIRFPLVTLSIGVISDYSCNTCSRAVDEARSLTREVGFRTAEVKRHAKHTSNHVSHDFMVNNTGTQQETFQKPEHMYRPHGLYTYHSEQSRPPVTSPLYNPQLEQQIAYPFIREDVSEFNSVRELA